jgi:hypothetical protein
LRDRSSQPHSAGAGGSSLALRVSALSMKGSMLMLVAVAHSSLTG